MLDAADVLVPAKLLVPVELTLECPLLPRDQGPQSSLFGSSLFGEATNALADWWKEASIDAIEDRMLVSGAIAAEVFGAATQAQLLAALLPAPPGAVSVYWIRP